MRSRVLVYFGSLLATIALINTPVPRLVVSAVLNPEAGDAVARSLGSITKDLVLVLLISIYFEWVRTREQGELLRGIDHKLDSMREESRAATAPSVRELVFTGAVPEELVRVALDRHIPDGPDKSSLASLILSPRGAHLDASISLRVERVEAQFVHVKSRYDTTMRRGPVLVAVTASPTRSTALSAACPELFYVTTLPWSRPFDEAVEAFAETFEFYVEVPSRATRRVEFRRVPQGSVRRHITLPVGMTSADLTLFIADLSQEKSELVRVHHYSRWVQELDDRFVYWAADRPTYVRTLTLDFRELVHASGRRVWAQPFLGSSDSLMLDAEEGHLSLRLDRWIVEGQGVVAIW